MNGSVKSRALCCVGLILVVSMSMLFVSCAGNGSNKGDKPAAAANQGVTAPDQRLLRGIINNNVGEVSSALNAGANANKIFEYNGGTITPIQVAAVMANRTIYQTLLNRGADADVSFKGYSAKDLEAYVGMDHQNN